MTEDWSVNGKGTKTTSPTSEPVIVGVSGVVPDPRECGGGELTGGLSQLKRSILPPLWADPTESVRWRSCWYSVMPIFDKF